MKSTNKNKPKSPGQTQEPKNQTLLQEIEGLKGAAGRAGRDAARDQGGWS